MSEPHASSPTPALHLIQNARLPRWVLSDDVLRTPSPSGQLGPNNTTVDIHIEHGCVKRISPSAVHTKASTRALAAQAGVLDVQGRLVLPGLVDAHTHLDKTLTLSRLGEVKPGLLNAIESMMKDRAKWSVKDIEERASTALHWALESGVSHIRTHCDWWEVQTTPLAWGVLNRLAADWSKRLQLDRVNLIPLTLFANPTDALALGQAVIEANEVHPGASLGGFIHTINWNPEA